MEGPSRSANSTRLPRMDISASRFACPQRRAWVGNVAITVAVASRARILNPRAKNPTRGFLADRFIMQLVSKGGDNLCRNVGGRRRGCSGLPGHVVQLRRYKKLSQVMIRSTSLSGSSVSRSLTVRVQHLALICPGFHGARIAEK